MQQPRHAQTGRACLAIIFPTSAPMMLANMDTGHCIVGRVGGAPIVAAYDDGRNRQRRGCAPQQPAAAHSLSRRLSARTTRWKHPWHRRAGLMHRRRELLAMPHAVAADAEVAGAGARTVDGAAEGDCARIDMGGRSAVRQLRKTSTAALDGIAAGPMAGGGVAAVGFVMCAHTTTPLAMPITTPRRAWLAECV